MKNCKVVFSSDIDGVFNDYPESFLRFIYLKKKFKFKHIEDAKNELGSQYSCIKNEYRSGSYKYNIPYSLDALEFYKELMRRDIEIIFSTSRPFEKYPGMHQKTENWLKKSGIKFTALVEKNKENFVKFGVDYHLDDELEHIEKLLYSDNECDFFILNRDGPKSLAISCNIMSVNSPQLILNLLDKKIKK